MTNKPSWSELPPAARASLIAVAAVDAGLRAWALRDLASRSPEQLRGPKRLWAVGLSIVNSAGVLPACYLLVARKAS